MFAGKPIQVCVCCESSTGQHSNRIKIQCVFDQWRQDVPSLKGDTPSLQILSRYPPVKPNHWLESLQSRWRWVGYFKYFRVFFLQLRAFINPTGTKCKDWVTMRNFQNAHVDSTSNPRISDSHRVSLRPPGLGPGSVGNGSTPWEFLKSRI